MNDYLYKDCGCKKKKEGVPPAPLPTPTPNKITNQPPPPLKQD